MIAPTTSNGQLTTTGSRYSADADALAREADLICSSEAQFNADFAAGKVGFDRLARQMGYRPGSLRKAIGGARTRDGVLQAILHHARVSDKANRVHLADAYLREVSAALSMAAEQQS